MRGIAHVMEVLSKDGDDGPFPDKDKHRAGELMECNPIFGSGSSCALDMAMPTVTTSTVTVCESCGTPPRLFLCGTRTSGSALVPVFVLSLHFGDDYDLASDAAG